VRIAIHTALILAASALALAQQSAKTAVPSDAHYPQIIHADVPLYPPLAWSAHFGGVVEVEVTIADGKVVNAQTKRVTVAAPSAKENPENSKLAEYLSVPSVENVKTWRFATEERLTFAVTYTYRIKGTETLMPENPTVVLDLPRSITVAARPFKPTVTP